MKDIYYTLHEVAEMLKISYMTVFRWVKNGKLESCKFGKQYRIKKDVLESFIRNDQSSI